MDVDSSSAAEEAKGAGEEDSDELKAALAMSMEAENAGMIRSLLSASTFSLHNTHSGASMR